jgi:3-deoxy-D-manno-octulosonic-acid transferase
MTDLSPGVRALFVVYTLCFEAVVWIALVPATWIRRCIGRRGVTALSARLGHHPPLAHLSRSGGAPVLIHAVSIGEMQAAAPLVAELEARSCRVLLTTGTAAGLDAARWMALAYPAVDDVTILPWDRGVVRGWLNRIAPAAVVVMETEIWPNLFRACATLDIPLFVANGRVRPRDVWRYRLARPFFTSVLESVAAIGVQSVEERDRFLAIGAPSSRVEVVGNLKFDAARDAGFAPATPPADARARPIIVAGSTHAPEEQWLVECAQHLERDGCPVRLVVAPRDIGRSEAVVRQASTVGLRVQRLSAPLVAEWDVMVLDQYNTLRAWYAVADIVVIGGTFAPVGGHNILEAAALGKPVLVGPHTEEIETIVKMFEHAGALIRVPDGPPARAIADLCRNLLSDRNRAQHIGTRAAALCREQAGGAARYAEVIYNASAPRHGSDDGGQKHTRGGH